MKTLIIYATKYGCTENCSKLLKDKLIGEVTTVNIKNDTIPDITSFDNIIVGGSIYIGKIQKEIRNFCTENLNVLNKKNIGLFICAMQKDNIETELNSAFPDELLSHAVVKESFGGEFIFKKMNFLERFIIKMIAKTENDISDISKENINKFAQLMNNL